MMNLLHIITGLELGGTEQMLCKILEGMNRQLFQSEVISLSGDGPAGGRLRMAGIPVTCLEMPHGRITAQGLWQLWRRLRTLRPDVVQTWLYHADLLGGVMAKFAQISHVCWNVRNTNLDPDKTRWHTRQVVRLCAGLSSHVPSMILCNSHQAAGEHQRRGYASQKFRIIPNGFDLQHFQRDPISGAKFRQQLGIPAEALVLGHVARFDPQKNHLGLLQAFAAVQVNHPQAHLVCCGTGVDTQVPQLWHNLSAGADASRLHLLGAQDDIPAVLSACDLFVLPSHGEAFPNVLGEAMACEVPCLVTNVGDSAEIVSDTGWVVPTNEPRALENELRWVLSLPAVERRDRGRRARQRVGERYELSAVVQQYEELYQSLVV